MHKIFGKYTNQGGRKDAVEITCVYPPGIMQTSSLGRLQEKSLEHKITFKQIVNFYSNAFKKHWNNPGTVCLDMLLQTRLAEFLLMFYVTFLAQHFLAQLSM